MRALALTVSVGVLTGCGVLFGVDGLEGGQCTGCLDAGAVLPVDDGGAEVGIADTASGVDAIDPDETSGADSSRADSSGTGDALPDGPVCTPPAPAGLDDCKAIAAMPASPVIDGVLDCGVALWNMPILGWNGTGSIPSGAQTQIGAAWRSDGLYLFVHVTGAGANRYPSPSGDGPWCGDAVELFVDSNGVYNHPPSYDVPGTMQFIVEAPTDAMNTATVGEKFQDGNDSGRLVRRVRHGPHGRRVRRRSLRAGGGPGAHELDPRCRSPRRPRRRGRPGRPDGDARQLPSAGPVRDAPDRDRRRLRQARVQRLRVLQPGASAVSP